MNRIRIAALSLLITAALSACGFRLAGDRPLPKALSSVYIELIDPYKVSAPPLQTALQARITRSGGAVKSRADDAETVLRLSDLNEGREVLSIGPDGRAIEYRLLTRVTFELRTADGTVLISPQSQVASRDFSFSAQQILPKEAEEARLRSYIQDQLAELVLLRVESALAKAPPASAIPPASPDAGALAPAVLPESLPAAPVESPASP